MSTTSSASSKDGARATTSPPGAITTLCPSKMSSSCPPTAFTSATQQPLSRARFCEHLLALHPLAQVERRRGEVRDHLRARAREVGDRRALEPDVLADRRADDRVAEPEEEQLARPPRSSAPRRRRRSSGGGACGTSPSPRRRRRRRTRCRACRRGGPACRRAPRSRPSRPRSPRGFRRRRAGSAARRSRSSGGVAGRRQLGEEDEVGAGVARLGEARQDLLPVAVEVADDGVDLRERDPHGRSIPGVFAPTAKTSGARG